MKDRNIVSLIFLFWLGTTAQTPDLQQLKTKQQQLVQMMQDLKKPIAKVEASETTPHTVNATVSMRPSRLSAEFRQPIERHDSEDIAKAYLEYAFLGHYDRTSLRLQSSTRKRNTKTLLVNGGAS